MPEYPTILLVMAIIAAPEDVSGYISTFQTAEGSLVWHIFERKE